MALRKFVETIVSRRQVMVVQEARVVNQPRLPERKRQLPAQLPKRQTNPHHTAKLAQHVAYHNVFGQSVLAKLESVGVDPHGRTVGYFTAYVKHPFDGRTYRHCWRYGVEGNHRFDEYVRLEHEFPCKPRS